MRDAKLLFRYKVAPTVASSAVDMSGREPGVGDTLNLSATYDLTGATAPTGDVTVTVSSSDTETGTYTNFMVITIPQARAGAGGVILSTPLASTAKRYLKTAWSGLTGGLLTDGMDMGLRDGTDMLDNLTY